MVLRDLCVLTHLMLTTTLCGKYIIIGSLWQKKETRLEIHSLAYGQDSNTASLATNAMLLTIMLYCLLMLQNEV